MDTIYRKFILEDRDFFLNQVVQVQMSKKKRARYGRIRLCLSNKILKPKSVPEKESDNNDDVQTRIKKSLQKKEDCFVITKGPAPSGKESYKLKQRKQNEIGK